LGDQDWDLTEAEFTAVISHKTMLNKSTLKDLLGEIPLTAEIYWHLRQAGKPIDPHFSLDKLARHLPDWTTQANEAAGAAPLGKRIAIFGVLRYWIEHTSLLGLTLAGMGNQVSLAFLPHDHWKKTLNRFDLRRQNAYALSVLRQAEPVLQIVSFVDQRGDQTDLPPDLQAAVAEVAYRDTQYSLQVEDVDIDSDLYRLRLERDSAAAQAALAWLADHKPDVVIIPNGSILEFGAVYAAARYLGLNVVTYEFGEQNHRIWLAQNREIMRQETDQLWAARQDKPLTDSQWEQVRALFAARQNASLWENFARRWQGVPSEGGVHLRSQLGLDERPIVLLATNVIGDSLTLGRQAFSESMTEWLRRTAQYFAGRPDVQFIIRIHPGELITSGPSVADVVQDTLPDLPAHIHLIAADAAVNTYDLVEIANLGLVYTTTVGMEMAMSGAPVIVSGKTHYRGKGFTQDPESWEGYLDLLDKILVDPASYRPSEAQVNLAWTYAYSFFFEYPLPFPWHLLHYWQEMDSWPLSRVLSPEGQAVYGTTLGNLSGEPLDWLARAA
jgi:hypothetical protein